eukprot:TRINITY_DN27282_c0_g1_i1.p1 TRINITY_DN27282_c0_g1~~TRINITY_DN27282_c0_g1_i1.p1  ORF type:complete len:481 (+),score=111.26 TRINITY_DN27282_c0_g1_i1:93-1445(+)
MKNRKDANETTSLINHETSGHGHGHSHSNGNKGHGHGHGHSHGDSGCSSEESSIGMKRSGSSGQLRGADCSDNGHRKELPPVSNVKKNKQKTSLAAGIVMCIVFMFVEIIGGYLAHSLAIMTDAAHLLTDVGALSLSFFAVHVSEQSSNNQYTFGWHRAEMIGALASIFSIWFLTGIILYEGVQRMITFSQCASMGLELAKQNITCESVDGKLMTVIGTLGLLVNIALAGILLWGGAKVQHAHSHGSGGCPSGEGGHSHDNMEKGHGHSHGSSHSAPEQANVNVQSAYLHALGDCINSIGVIIAALIIWWGNTSLTGNAVSVSSWYNLADPCASLLFGVITLWTTVALTKDILEVLMEGVPTGVNYHTVLKGLERIPNVLEVHDLHIWSLTTDKLSLSVHLVGDTQQHSIQILQDAQHFCRDLPRSITHTTIQIDPKGECCAARCFSDVH